MNLQLRPPDTVRAPLGALALILAVLLALPAAIWATPLATPQAAPTPTPVVELLRLQVPAQQREAWWTAERDSWGVWLEQQDGFLARQLLWDPQRQEGLLLIHWASREQWQAIPKQELAMVQRRFETLARERLREQGGSPSPLEPPFPLLEEGELQNAPFNPTWPA